MVINLRGGKTAPRLLQDLTNLDLRQLSAGAGDDLTQIPFHDASKDDEDPPLPRVGCRHQWTIKQRQSKLPENMSYEPKEQTEWTFACTCTECRAHVDLRIEYNSGISSLKPCPSADHPLHHFVNRSKLARSTTTEVGGTDERSAVAFQCSAANCGVIITLRFREAKLTSEWVSLLTDKHMIKMRADSVILQDPEKFQGHTSPTPGTVLERLGQLVGTALSGTGRMPISRSGKLWLLNLGEPCVGLMEYLGFSSDGSSWQWPELTSGTETPYEDPLRIKLDDVREELQSLMLARPIDERKMSRFDFTPRFAEKELSLALGCKDYKQSPKARTVDLTADEHPCYAGIGSVANFHDELICFAYERQIETDPDNVAYYLECLQVIANGRNSEDLLTTAAIEASQGRISLKDVRTAYRNFNIDMHHENLADATIIGTFQARLSDAPKQESDLRRDLTIIGQHRKSVKIQNAASQAISNYQQALSFLDATEDTTDEFITSLFSIRIDGKASEESNARQAVALIANHRKSRALKQWLDTGNLGEVDMDVGQAYARLDISDLIGTEDDMIVTLFNVHTEEQPSQVDNLRRALAVIAKSRNSKVLMDYAGIASDGSAHPLGEWPVGLNNIGNTCYLNSLLQFYFSVKPFRDLVLDFDNHKMSLDDDSVKSKRVGGRNVSRKEVERAQRTAQELNKLFRDLITSSTRSVRPDTEVARLTLLTPKAEIARRQSIRQSMNSTERPIHISPLGDINGLAIEGPAGPPKSQPSPEDAIMVDSPSPTIKGDLPLQDQEITSSTETLVDGPIISGDSMDLDNLKKVQQLSALEIEGNLPAYEHSAGEDLAAEENIETFTEDPPSETNEQSTHDIEQTRVAAESNKEQPHATTSFQPPPNRPPPPIPPRPKLATDANEAVREAEFAAQQQDVNEIAYNVLNQMQCAIKPLAVDQSGEQIDQIKQIFYGKVKTFITSSSGQIRSKEEYMSDIKVNVLAGPRDIYSALDGAFDVEDVAVAGGIEPKYYTISQLPPVLQIHVQRGQFDPLTKKESKSDNHLDLKEVIYMDRYMDSSDEELLQRRKDSWEWKKQLGVLENRRGQLIAPEMNMAMFEVLEHAHGYLQQLNNIEGDHAMEVPPVLFETLEKAAKEAKAELERIHPQIRDLRTKITSQFSDLRQVRYRLSAVFIHRGSSSAGHYWIYIYDFKAGIWRSYNDEHVTQVRDVGEIFNAPTGQRPPTPYFVVYVRDERKEDLIDVVCRDVAGPPTEESGVQDTIRDDWEPIEIDDQLSKTYTTIQPTAVHMGPTGDVPWDDSQHVNGSKW